MKLGEDLKTWTGSTKSDKNLAGTDCMNRNVWNDQVSKNPRDMKLCGVVVQIM